MLPNSPFVDDLKPEFGLIDVNRDLASELGIVAAWPFAEGGGTAVRDVVGNSNGAVTTNSSPWRAGVQGMEFLFSSSSDYIDITPRFSLTGQMTIIISLRAVTTTDGLTIIYPISFSNGGSLVFAIRVGGNYFDSNFTVKGIALFNVAGGTSASSVANTYTDANDLGKQRQLVITYDKNATQKTRIYKDGVELAMSTDGVTGNLPAFDSIRLGQRNDGAWPWPGSESHVAIGNMALTASEVRALYSPDSWALYRPGLRNVFAIASVAAIQGSATISAQSAVTISGYSVKQGRASVSSAGTLLSSAYVVRTGQGIIAGSGALTASGYVVRTGRGTISGAASFLARAYGVSRGRISIQGQSDFTVTGMAVAVSGSGGSMFRSRIFGGGVL